MNHSISRQVTAALAERMATEPVISTAEAMTMLEPFYKLNTEAVTAREIRKLVSRCAKRVPGEDNGRIVYLLKDRQLIVNTELCDDPALLQAVALQIKRQMIGCSVNYRRMKKRYEAITGQISIDDLLQKVE